MSRRPPISTRPDTRVPYTTLFRFERLERGWNADPKPGWQFDLRHHVLEDLDVALVLFQRGIHAFVGLLVVVPAQELAVLGDLDAGVEVLGLQQDRKGTRLNHSP